MYNIPDPVPLSGDGFKDQLFHPQFNFGDVKVLDQIFKQKKTFISMLEEFDQLPPEKQNSTQLRDMIQDVTGFQISVEEAQKILRKEYNEYYRKDHSYLSEKEFPVFESYKEYYVYGSLHRSALIARALSKHQFVVWGTGTHTSTPVAVIAKGPKDTLFDGIHHSSEVGGLLRRVAGIQ